MKDDIDTQAIRWFTRLRAPDVTSTDRHNFNQWLEADFEHELAYARAEQEWQDVGGLESWARDELAQLNLQHARRPRGKLLVGLAAAASLVVAVLWWQGMEPTAGSRMTVTTAKAEQRQLALDDGSRLHVNTDSDLEIRYSASVREVIVKRGEGAFDVDHDESRPFVVRAGKHNVIAIGTSFAVYRTELGHWSVTVLEGRVAVVPDTVDDFMLSSEATTSARGGLILERNEQLVIDASGEISSGYETDAEAVTAWRRGVLKFYKTPLREAVREISRYTHNNVQVADGVPDYDVTGIINIRSHESMVSLLAAVVPVAPVNHGSGVTILYDVRSD
ncbi:MAG: FecR domain-containing protein [Gammaproteobacteria bacterium]|nr:FecR domain-containing protein [Gammaproteobacteria bacterium]